MKKKLISAIAMLTVSAVTLSTATYAWFTMNKEVTVTGMQVRTKVGSNLLIVADSYDPDEDENNRDNKYTTDIKQIRQCLLEPSSTVDGINYWYTVEASADGQILENKEWIAYNENASTAVENSLAGKLNYDPKFNLKYLQGGTSGTFTSSDIQMVTSGATTSREGAAYGYIDYVFYIKGTADAAEQKIVMTKCNLQYNGTSLQTSGAIPEVDRAWRVALFSQAASRNTDLDTALAAEDLITVLKPENAINFTPDKAVNAADSTDEITNHDEKAVVGTIANSGDTAYYKVTVRLWLEGEDTTCTSETYAKLTNLYSLDLEFKLENNDDNAVTAIGSEAGWYGKLHSGT
jgi:hypothetical protein